MLQHVGKLILNVAFFTGRQVLVRQEDMGAKKAKAISPDMHITGASETTDADAATIPSQIIWSSKLLLEIIHKHHSGRDSVLPPVAKVLLWYVFENCKQGIQVTMRMVRKYKVKNCPYYCKK